MLAPVVEHVVAEAFSLPTDRPEADGTSIPSRLVLVRATAGGITGFGHTYGESAVSVIRDPLADAVLGKSAMDVPAAWEAMARSVHKIGLPGIASLAISAVDTALWDLKAKLLGVPLVFLLGRVRHTIPVHGSGGSDRELDACQKMGIRRIKVRIGDDAPAQDSERLRAVRQAIGLESELYVDAGGAYLPRQALMMAARLAELSVSYFENPVNEEDFEALRFLRSHAPPQVEIAAGATALNSSSVERLLRSQAIDILTLDATRCGGITGFLRCSAVAGAHGIPIATRGAPHLHLHLGCATPGVRHIEYDHDYARVERMVFDSLPLPSRGLWQPDLTRSGLGWEPRDSDLRHRVAA